MKSFISTYELKRQALTLLTSLGLLAELTVNPERLERLIQAAYARWVRRAQAEQAACEVSKKVVSFAIANGRPLQWCKETELEEALAYAHRQHLRAVSKDAFYLSLAIGQIKIELDQRRRRRAGGTDAAYWDRAQVGFRAAYRNARRRRG